MKTGSRWVKAAIVVAVLAGFAALAGRRPDGERFPAREGDPSPEHRGALVDEIIFTREGDLGKVLELLSRGACHVFASGISNPAIYRRARSLPALEYDYAFGTSGELTVNPAGPRFRDGSLNPFHDRRMREALNWLIDRRYIAEEIYGGLAVPRYLPLNTVFPDYARLAETARALEIRYAHDPDRARAVIRERMEALGARLEGGTWVEGGRPVRLRVLIRTENERRRVGDYLSDLLEESGFRVERMYRNADEASRIWIAGDPREGRWNLYTGAWVSTIIQRDLAGNFDFYYNPRGRPEPLWQVYEPDPEFDELSGRLQRRDYRDRDERRRMMARALELAMEDSVRVWLIDEMNIVLRSAEITLASDLAAGISGSALWPYTLRFRGRTGGRAIFAIPSLLTEPWNPVDGTNWVFDRMIMRALDDGVVIADPFTGLYLPQRVQAALVTIEKGHDPALTHDWVTIEEVDSIEVPGDAWIDWDAPAGRFVTVAEKHPGGLSARTRTRVLYEPGFFERRWHDGTRVSPADVLFGWIFSFERSKPGSPLYDRAHNIGFESFQRHYRGWRVLGWDPLEVEVFSDQVFPDAEWIAAVRAPGATPWHLMAVAVLAEKGGELAFSSDKADLEGVEWMNFIAGPSLPILERRLRQARLEEFVPFESALGEYLEPGEATERYRALESWYAERGHFWVSDGVFLLHSVHPVEQMVVLRRFEDFPDPAGKWLRFSRPAIPALELDGEMILAEGRPAEFELRVFFDDQPYPDADIEDISWLVFDRRGRVLVRGRAEPAGPAGTWRIAIDEEQAALLGRGARTLEVSVSSRRVAMPVFASHAFALIP